MRFLACRRHGPAGRAAVLALGLVAALSGCSRDAGDAQAKAGTGRSAPGSRPPVSVAVAPVVKKPMAVTVEAIGTVEPSTIVAVKAQVGGELLRIHFQEGQDVRRGDLLFTIDPRPLETALAQSQANLAKDVVQVQQARAALKRDEARVMQSRATAARDQAQLRNAEVETKRYAELLKRDLVAQEQYDQFRTTAESLTATVAADQADVQSAEETVRVDEAAVKAAEQLVRADEAAVENAKIQLGYTVIRSPVNGRTGSLALHQGNIVTASNTTLVTIHQIQPIFVSFTVPQQQLPAIKRYMAEGTLAVTALPAGDAEAARGAVSFIDNAVDQTTGTIRLKATFPNADRRLWPGQFVNVALTLTTEPNAIVIPSQALQTGQQGQFVFVVKPDATVDARAVNVARVQGNEAVIASGLEPGERVVTDGQPRLVQGAKVEVRKGGSENGVTRPGAGAPPGTTSAPATAPPEGARRADRGPRR